MASKYLSTGTATYTLTTRAISGATMSAVFAAGDVGKGIVFRIGTAVHYGRIASYVSTTSVTLEVGGSLPSSNGTIAELFMLDLGETHTFQSYIDEVRSNVPEDDITKLPDSSIQAALKSAVTQFGKDKPQTVRKLVAGNGTGLYDIQTILGSLFVNGFTAIQSIEYPSDQVPRTILEPSDWEIFDDGTAQDGSNMQLQFMYVMPQSTENFVCDISLQLSLPEVGTQNFPDTEQNFSAITMLASGICCLKLAAAYAPSSDSTINADVVNYHDKSRKYTDLARNYFKRYSQLVFGNEEPQSSVAAAFLDVDLDTTLSNRNGDFLFHQRKGRTL